MIAKGKVGRATGKMMLRRTLVLNIAHKGKVDSKDGFEWMERCKEKIWDQILAFSKVLNDQGVGET